MNENTTTRPLPTITPLYTLPGDEWKIVCDAMGYAAWLALNDERENPRNEGQMFGASRFLVEKLKERREQSGGVFTTDYDLFMHYFQPNFRDCYQSVLALSDAEYAAAKAEVQVNLCDGGITHMALQYRHIHGDRAREIITKEHNRFSQ